MNRSLLLLLALCVAICYFTVSASASTVSEEEAPVKYVAFLDSSMRPINASTAATKNLKAVKVIDEHGREHVDGHAHRKHHRRHKKVKKALKKAKIVPASMMGPAALVEQEGTVNEIVDRVHGHHHPVNATTAAARGLKPVTLVDKHGRESKPDPETGKHPQRYTLSSAEVPSPVNTTALKKPHVIPETMVGTVPTLLEMDAEAFLEMNGAADAEHESEAEAETEAESEVDAEAETETEGCDDKPPKAAAGQKQYSCAQQKNGVNVVNHG